MQKILIFGNSGSGKSTFAKRLGDILNIPVCHLDEICCDDNYKRLPTEIIVPRIQKVMEAESWIIEWNYSSTLFLERIERADTAIIFEIPAYVCLYRAIKRFLAITGKKETRIGNTDKQKNSLSLKFIHWIIWRYPRDATILRNKAISSHGKQLYIQKLGSWRDIKTFLDNIKQI